MHYKNEYVYILSMQTFIESIYINGNLSVNIGIINKWIVALTLMCFSGRV